MHLLDVVAADDVLLAFLVADGDGGRGLRADDAFDDAAGLGFDDVGFVTLGDGAAGDDDVGQDQGGGAVAGSAKVGADFVSEGTELVALGADAVEDLTAALGVAVFVERGLVTPRRWLRSNDVSTSTGYLADDSQDQPSKASWPMG